MGELRRDGQGLARKVRALPPKRKREHERRSAAPGDRRIGDVGLLLVKPLTALKTVKAKMGCIPTAMALKTIKASGLTNVWFYHDNQARRVRQSGERVIAAPRDPCRIAALDGFGRCRRPHGTGGRSPRFQVALQGSERLFPDLRGLRANSGRLQA